MARDPFQPEHREGSIDAPAKAKVHEGIVIDQQGGDYIRAGDMTIRSFPYEWSFGEKGEVTLELFTHEGVLLDSKVVKVK